MRESKIREALKARVESYGGEVRAIAWLGRRYAPDVLCLFPTDSHYALTFDYSVDEDATNLHPFIETKRPGEDATAAQAREHKRLRDAGFDVYVITTLEKLDYWLPPL